MTKRERKRQQRLLSIAPIRDQVKAALKRLKMPDCTFAGNAGIGDTTMDDFLSGQVATKPDVLAKIVDYLNLLEAGKDVEYLAADRAVLLDLLASRDAEINELRAKVDRLEFEPRSSSTSGSNLSRGDFLMDLLEKAARDVLRDAICAGVAHDKAAQS